MNIRTMMIAIIYLLFMSSVVSAGSINDAQYYDRNTFWGDWHGGTTRTINDNDVTIDADTVGGVDVVDELNNLEDEVDDNSYDINKNKKKINKNRRNVRKTSNYIADNEADWSIDKTGDGGLSMNTVSRFVTGNPHYYTEMPYGYSVMQEIEETYPTKLELETTNLRLDKIEAWLEVGEGSGDEYDQSLALITAKRTDVVQTIGRYKCYPIGICFEDWE